MFWQFAQHFVPTDYGNQARNESYKKKNIILMKTDNNDCYQVNNNRYFNYVSCFASKM